MNGLVLDAQSRLLPDIIEYLKDKPLQLREVTDCK